MHEQGGICCSPEHCFLQLVVISSFITRACVVQGAREMGLKDIPVWSSCVPGITAAGFSLTPVAVGKAEQCFPDSAVPLPVH